MLDNPGRGFVEPFPSGESNAADCGRSRLADALRVSGRGLRDSRLANPAGRRDGSEDTCADERARRDARNVTNRLAGPAEDRDASRVIESKRTSGTHEIGEAGCYRLLSVPMSRAARFETIGYTGFEWNATVRFRPVERARKRKTASPEARRLYQFSTSSLPSVRRKNLKKIRP